MDISKTALYDISIVIPTLNEEKSIGKLVKKTKNEIKKIKKKICIIVSDNGSEDKTLEIAKKHKVIIHRVSKTGYGANLINVIKKIKSNYTLFFDADGSYRPEDIKLFVNEFEKDPNLIVVTGNRLRKAMKGAMPFLNRYFGTPVLSFLVSLFFKEKVIDCYSGMRVFRTADVKKLKLKCDGMEFASEFFIKVINSKYKYKEIEITLKKDERDQPPHLNRWVDGWRHLRFIYANAPDVYLIVPFIFVILGHLIAYILSFYNLENVAGLPRYHTIFSLIALNNFIAVIFIGILSIRISIFVVDNVKFKMIENLIFFDKRNYFLNLFMFFLIIGFIELIFLMYVWYGASFGEINEMDNVIRMIIYASLSSFSLFINLLVESNSRSYNVRFD